MKNDVNLWWIAAGISSLLTTLLHVFGGGPEFMGPYASFGMEAKFYAMIEVFWNQITLLLAMVGIAFLIASKRGARAMDMVLFVNALYLGIALIFMVIGLAFLPSLFVLPQWILFLFMAALGQIGWHIQKGRVR